MLTKNRLEARPQRASCCLLAKNPLRYWLSSSIGSSCCLEHTGGQNPTKGRPSTSTGTGNTVPGFSTRLVHDATVNRVYLEIAVIVSDSQINLPNLSAAYDTAK